MNFPNIASRMHYQSGMRLVLLNFPHLCMTVVSLEFKGCDKIPTQALYAKLLSSMLSPCDKSVTNFPIIPSWSKFVMLLL